MTYTNGREDILQFIDERNETWVVDVDPEGAGVSYLDDVDRMECPTYE